MPESRNIAIKRTINRKSAAAQQIDMAIRLFDEDEYACAITLALAAEDSLPDPTSDKAYLLGTMKASGATSEIDVNKIRNWLKHKKDADEIGISEFDVFGSILRAVSKYSAVYDERTLTMKKFYAWCKQEGFFDLKFVPSGS